MSRQSLLGSFLIDGATVIEVKRSPLLMLSFLLNLMDPNSFYLNDVPFKLAILFNIHSDKIRRVQLISASNETWVECTWAHSNAHHIRLLSRRSQAGLFALVVEMRDDPRTQSQGTSGIREEILSNIASTVINRQQCGGLFTDWKSQNITAGQIPTSCAVQEPFDQSSTTLQQINRTELRTAPGECREQSPCTIQPALIAFDAQNQIIDKLGSNDQPWRVKISIVNQPAVILQGGTAPYLNGQTRFTQFALPNIDSFELQFTFIQPDGVSR
jgi:hypothetical protein